MSEKALKPTRKARTQQAITLAHLHILKSKHGVKIVIAAQLRLLIAVFRKKRNKNKPKQIKTVYHLAAVLF